jgi:hypothetical protein
MTPVGKTDLHLHTTASDGILTPAELVAAAVKNGLQNMAVTDHDTTAGVDPALAAASHYPGLLVIPGIELAADVASGEVHVLGYFLDQHDPALEAALTLFRDSRRNRARQMLEKLANLGMPLDWSEVEALAKGASVGRPHVAEALVRRGYVGSIREAFDRFIGRECPAYVERHKLTPPDAVALIRKAGGAAVLAHPGFVHELARWLEEMIEAGLAGLEVYYPAHSREVEQDLLCICRDRGLIPTGGSDYHGQMGPNEAPMGSMPVPADTIPRLRAAAGS